MDHIGNTKKTRIFRKEMGKLHVAFEVSEEIAVVELSANLVADDDLVITINGTATTTAFDTNTQTTLLAAATALEARDDVVDVAVDATNKRMLIYLSETVKTPVLAASVTHGGAGTATATIGYFFKSLTLGAPVVFTPAGKIRCATSIDSSFAVIGISMHDKAANGGDATVAMKGYAEIRMKAGDDLVAGPVGLDSANYLPDADGLVYVKNSTTDAATIGWAYTPVSSGNEVMVIVMN